MADTKISALLAKATPVAGDTLVIVDSVGGANKKITAGTLPISTAQQAALDLKADASAISNIDNTSDANKPVSTATQTALNLKADASAISNVDNTSDANKPVSTAQQTALDAKFDNDGIFIKSLATGTTVSTTTLTDTGLEFPIAANETWKFDFKLQNGCNNTGGLKYAVISPTGSEMRAKLTGTTSGNTAITSNILTTNVECAVNLNTVNSQGGWADITGMVTNGSTPGVVKLQFRSIVDTQISSFYKESSLVATRIN